MALSGLGFGLFVPPIIDIVLVNVAPERAGAASGALAAMQQVGGALGVAVLGIIFFGLIGHHAPDAARNAGPTLSTAVAATGAPRAESTRAAEAFQPCFVQRSRAADPTVTPPGCAVPSDASPAVAAAYSRAAHDATAHTFSTSSVQAMWYQVVIYLLVLAFLFRLPKVNPRRLAELDDSARSATGG